MTTSPLRLHCSGLPTPGDGLRPGTDLPCSVRRRPPALTLRRLREGHPGVHGVGWERYCLRTQRPSDNARTRRPANLTQVLSLCQLPGTHSPSLRPLLLQPLPCACRGLFATCPPRVPTRHGSRALLFRVGTIWPPDSVLGGMGGVGCSWWGRGGRGSETEPRPRAWASETGNLQLR